MRETYQETLAFEYLAVMHVIVQLFLYLFLCIFIYVGEWRLQCPQGACRALCTLPSCSPPSPPSAHGHYRNDGGGVLALEAANGRERHAGSRPEHHGRNEDRVLPPTASHGHSSRMASRSTRTALFARPHMSMRTAIACWCVCPTLRRFLRQTWAWPSLVAMAARASQGA